MTPQELKNSILQLAIQGKLVEQCPEEGTAEELYQQIQEEKQRLVKEGEIKKEKPLPEIAEEEMPFEIPESWKWVRLGDCSSYAQRKEKVSAVAIAKDAWSLDLEDIEKETGRILQKHLASERKIAGDKVKFYKGQVLYSKLRPYLKKVLVAPDDGICSSEIVPFSMYGNINSQYIVYVLICPHVDYVINSVTYGVKMPRVGTETMVNLLVPLPPLTEQKRIAAKIEELLPYIDRYEQAWNRLEDFNKRFPVDMQKSLLQWAIQGKLVEQRPEEGTADELYRQIQEEKQRLVKEGKIKKEKPLPEIAEDEVPFEIPESWKWVNLNRIAESIVDCPHSTPKYLNAATEYYTVDTNCINEKGDITRWRYIDVDTYEKRIARLPPQKDDIIYTREGSICRAAILPDGKKICLGQRVMLIRCANGVFPQFVRKMLMSPTVINKLTEQQKGIGAKHVNVSDVCSLLLPLPPLAEQKRIVARLEELLPLCERLK